MCWESIEIEWDRLITRQETASSYRAPVKGKAFIFMAREDLERSLMYSCTGTWTIWNTSRHWSNMCCHVPHLHIASFYGHQVTTPSIIMIYKPKQSQPLSCVNSEMSNYTSAQYVTLQIKIGWRKLKTCWYISSKWFWPRIFAQLAEAGKRHSAA
jgi:hypothetical protein